jgi:septin family protein
MRLFKGRTTFVNTLCGKSVLPHKESDDPNGAHVEDGVKIKPVTVGMRARLVSPILRRV